jgi:TPR repeat protein
MGNAGHHPRGTTTIERAQESNTVQPAVAAARKSAAIQFQQEGDWRMAFEAWRAAAEQGDAEAMFTCGTYLENGLGVSVNPKEAFAWFAKAAASRHIAGVYALGRCYSEGIGTPRRPVKANRLFQSAARAGDADAQYALGLAYIRGEGVRADAKKGVRWLRRAAEQGLAAAQYSLGLSYSRGHGVPANLEEAERWYARAAEGGDPDAEQNLKFVRVQRQVRRSAADSERQQSEAAQTVQESSNDESRKVAEELELTVRHGDFLRLGERLIAGQRKESGEIRWRVKNIDEKESKSLPSWDIGDRVDVTVLLPVRTVLGNRNVKPADVVALFAADSEQGRGFTLESVGGKDWFALTQRYVVNREFIERLQRITYIALSRHFTSAPVRAPAT